MRRLLALSLLIPEMALACKCAAPTAAGRAKSHADLVKAFYTILGSGRRVRFTVKTAYRGTRTKTTRWMFGRPLAIAATIFKPAKPIWYMPMAPRKPARCPRIRSGTKRLSDAGGDLAYLYFFENNGDDSARLDGFATSNELHQLGCRARSGAGGGRDCGTEIRARLPRHANRCQR